MSFQDNSTLVYPITNEFPAKKYLASRNPTSNDFRSFNLFDNWINKLNKTYWSMVGKTATSGTWVQAASTGTGILTITGNAGPAVGADGSNNINVIGGGPFVITGVSGTHTLTLTSDGTIPITFDEDSGSATASSGVINIVGAGGVSTSGAGNTITITAGSIVPTTFTTDAGNAQPSANVLNVFGGTGIATSGSGNTVTIAAASDVPTSFATDSGTATPASNSITIHGAGGITTSGAGHTVTVTAGATIATTYTANSGTATPALNNLNILGTSPVNTVASGSTVTVSVAGTVATSYVTGSGTAVPSGGVLNVLASGGATTSGSGNTITINTPTGGLNWQEVTVAGPTAMAVNNGYMANAGVLVRLTLPSVAAQFSIIQVVAKGTGLFRIEQNAGQTIHMGSNNTTLGAGGSITANGQYYSISLICSTANTDFIVYDSFGEFTGV